MTELKTKQPFAVEPICEQVVSGVGSEVDSCSAREFAMELTRCESLFTQRRLWSDMFLRGLSSELVGNKLKDELRLNSELNLTPAAATESSATGSTRELISICSLTNLGVQTESSASFLAEVVETVFVF